MIEKQQGITKRYQGFVVHEKQQKILTLAKQKWAKLLGQNATSDAALLSILYSQVWLHKHFHSQQSQFNKSPFLHCFSPTSMLCQIINCRVVLETRSRFWVSFLDSVFKSNHISIVFVQFMVASA